VKELDEIIGDLIYKAEECMNDGTHWVRSSDFSEIADRLIAINKKLLADLTEKPTPGRPFRRGEPVLVWDDDLYQFIGFFVKHTDSGFVVSGNSELLPSLTWSHCKHLPTFIAWDLIDEYYGWAAEYDSGLVTLWVVSPEVGYENNSGTIVAVHKRPEAQK